MDEIAAKEARGKPIEIWFQDEARIGQKNKITRRWARRGTRPSAPTDQRTSSAYIFGAICPAEGKGAGLVLPSCNSEAMALHLAEISLAAAPGAHALVLLDPGGMSRRNFMSQTTSHSCHCRRSHPRSTRWKTSGSLCRGNWLSNRVFNSYDDILDHCCCCAWNKLIDMPWKIISIGVREWAYRS